MKKIPPIVLVEWEDAVHDSSSWVDNEDHDYKPKIFKTVAYLLLDEPRGIIISSTWHDDTVASRDQIPRGMIRKVTRLKV